MFKLKHFILSILFKMFYSSLIKEMEIALKDTYISVKANLSNNVEIISFNGEMLGCYTINNEHYTIRPYHSNVNYGGNFRLSCNKKYIVHFYYYN